MQIADIALKKYFVTVDREKTKMKIKFTVNNFKLLLIS